jgi:hypothetical protein
MREAAYAVKQIQTKKCAAILMKTSPPVNAANQSHDTRCSIIVEQRHRAIHAEIGGRTTIPQLTMVEECVLAVL